MSGIRFDRDWYACGGRHGIDNRMSDLSGFLEEDLSSFTAIDIGCAEGEMIERLASRFGAMDGAEKSPHLFERLQQRFEYTPEVQLWNLDIAVDDLQQDYDYVFLLGVLHYFVEESVRHQILDKLLRRTRRYLFVRTSFFENLDTRGLSLAEIEARQRKSTRLSTVADVSERHGFRWVFVDNRYRGRGEDRLGSLVVLKRVECVANESVLQFCDRQLA